MAVSTITAPEPDRRGQWAPLRRLSRFTGPAPAGLAGIALLTASSAAPAPPSVALPIGLTGMGVLVLAWLRLGRRLADASATALYRTCVLWTLPLLAAPPLFSRDVFSYVAQGVIADRGLDPYELGPAQALGSSSPVTQLVSDYWQDTPAPYGPVFLALARVIAGLAGGDPVASVMLHRAVAIVGMGLIAWALPRLATRCGARPAAALWLGLLNPLVLFHVIGGAHNDGLMVGLMLAGLELGLSGGPSTARSVRVAAGVGLVTVAANVKAVAVIALASLAAELVRRATTPARRLAVAAGVVAWPAAITVAVATGTGLGFGWLRAITVPTTVYSWLAPTNQFGLLAGAAGSAAGHDITAAAVSTATRLGAAAGGAIAIYLLWTVLHGRSDPLRACGLMFAAAVALGPVVHPWYLSWIILPLAAATGSDRGRQRLAILSAAFALVLPPAPASVGVLIGGYAVLAGLLIARRRRAA
jgi:alpha-1,6-mannosyltransferase